MDFKYKIGQSVLVTYKLSSDSCRYDKTIQQIKDYIYAFRPAYTISDSPLGVWEDELISFPLTDLEKILYNVEFTEL